MNTTEWQAPVRKLQPDSCPPANLADSGPCLAMPDIVIRIVIRGAEVDQSHRDSNSQFPRIFDRSTWAKFSMVDARVSTLR